MSKNKYGELRTQPKYLMMIAANVVNRFGDSIDAIAFSWLMYDVTGSASLMALILGLNFIPTIVLQPFAGVVVDKIPKKMVMVLTDAVRGVLVCLTAAFYLGGILTPGVLIAVTLLESTVEALRTPAGIAVMPLLLDEQYYELGTALNSSLSRIMEIAGMALAGGIIALIGSAGALFIDAATFFFSAVVIFLIKMSETIEKAKIDFKSVLSGFGDGIRFFRSSKVLQALLLVGMLMNFCVIPFNSLQTAYVADWTAGGPETLSVINIACTVGMALGAFFEPKMTHMTHKNMIVVFGIVTTAPMLAFAALPNVANAWFQLALLALCAFVMGVGSGVINVVFGAGLMKIVDREQLGRIGGLTNCILCLACPIASFMTAIIANYMEVPWVMLVSGVLSMVLYLAVLAVKPLEEL